MDLVDIMILMGTTIHMDMQITIHIEDAAMDTTLITENQVTMIHTAMQIITIHIEDAAMDTILITENQVTMIHTAMQIINVVIREIMILIMGIMTLTMILITAGITTLTP